MSIVLILSLSTPAFALYTSGYAGISDYGGCPYGNRAGSQYVSKLQDNISDVCNQKFMLTDASANKYVFQSTWSNSVDFFAYSGHGTKSSNYNALHFRSIGNDARDHTSSDHSDSAKLAKIEARTTEIRLGGTLKYATFYTCNFLTNDGSASKQEEIFKMFEGARLVMGFASQMYLDSREAINYGGKLETGLFTIEDAFITAAQRYQAQRTDSPSIARVVGYTGAANDRFRTTTSVLPSSSWYKNNKSLFNYQYCDDPCHWFIAVYLNKGSKRREHLWTNAINYGFCRLQALHC